MNERFQVKENMWVICIELILEGLREGSRLSLLGAKSRGFDSPHVHIVWVGSSNGESTRLLAELHEIVPRPTRHIIAPPIAGTYSQGASSARGRKDGVSRPAVIFALNTEESKDQNEVPRDNRRIHSVLRRDSYGSWNEG
jgi:hypothetical protein